MSEVFFNGPAGRIEGRYRISNIKEAPLALILHPHPQHGGTMRNNVVFALYKTLAENGFTVLRINFRGVGRSQGQYDKGIGELTDAATALDWLQLNNESNINLIAGFSFGAWIALQLLMRRPEIKSFIAVSPPVNKYDFSFLSPCPCPGLIIQGDQDSVVPEEAVAELSDKISKQQRNFIIDYQVIKGADHFYRTKLEELKNITNTYLQNNFLNNMDGPPNFNPNNKNPSEKIYLG